MITQTYSLDLIPNGQPLIVYASQYDKKARVLAFNLYVGGVSFEMPTGASASIGGTKRDGKAFLYSMEVDGSTVSIPIEEQMTVLFGDVPCEIQISDVSGNKLGTANFTLRVEKAPLDEDAISDTDIPIFEQLVDEAKEAASEAKEAASEASEILPSGGTAGQYLQKTASGTQWADVEAGDSLPAGGTAGQVLTKLSATDGDAGWEDPTGGGGESALVVTFTYENSAYSADKTFAEVYQAIQDGRLVYGLYSGAVFEIYTFNETYVRFAHVVSSAGGAWLFNLSSGNILSIVYSPINFSSSVTISKATSDSTVYTSGYKLILENSYIVSTAFADITFPNGDYSGNITWETTSGKLTLYFDSDPSGLVMNIQISNGVQFGMTQ